MAEDYTSMDRLGAFLRVAREVSDVIRAITKWRQLALEDHVISVVANKSGWKYMALSRDGTKYSGEEETFQKAISVSAQLVQVD